MTNRTALPTILALLATTAAATAADLPWRKTPFIAPPPPVFTWDGFYIGAQIGYGFGTDRNRTYIPPAGAFSAGAIGPATAFGNNSANTSGVLGGAFIGHNWQLGSFVFGTETDIDISGMRGTAAMTGMNIFAPSFVSGLGTVGSASYREDWRMSSRIRIGYSFGRLLVYAAGGGAYGSFRFNNAYNSQFNVLTPGFTPLFGVQENYKTTRFGGTIGGGLEYAITDNWLARIDYRYTDFGTEKQSLNGSPFYVQEHRLTDHVVRAGIAYKLGGGGLLGTYVPFLGTPGGPGDANWTGIKAGGQLGYGWGTDNVKLSQPALVLLGATPYGSFPLGQTNAKPGGVLGGAHIGFDQQWGRLVSGAEVSIDGSGVRGSTGLLGVNLFAPTAFAALGSPIGTVSIRNDWRGAVTGRLGYAWGSTLIYALSGMSFAQFNFTSAYNSQFAPGAGITPSFFVTDSFSKLRLGGVIGGGVEYALNDRWSVRAEYRYTDFGKFREVQKANFVGMVQEHRLSDSVMQAGFSYNFTPMASAPVVAKY